jgi:hypothetical protein
MKKTIILILALAAVGTGLRAQDASYLEVLRSDVRTQRAALITQAMQFTEAQAAVFWPICRRYDAELQVLNDKRIATILDYGKHMDSLTDAKANELTEQTFSYYENLIKIQRKYYAEFAKALSPRIAAKFMQVERKINTYIDVQLQANIPLVK